MTTYAESKGKQPFDWRAFLSKSFDEVTVSEVSAATMKAGSWVECACGNKDDRLPRGDSGQPDDRCLGELGGLFDVICEYMCDAKEMSPEAKQYESYRRKAIRVIDEIDARETVLLKEIEAKERKS